jgi:hypothetical protein
MRNKMMSEIFYFSALLFLIAKMSVMVALYLSLYASSTQSLSPPHHYSSTSTSSPEAEVSDASTPPPETEVTAVPRQLSANQCSLGVNFLSVDIYSGSTLPGRLYVDFGMTTPCMGVITRWEACFDRSRSASGAIDFVVLRLNPINQSWQFVGVKEIRFSIEPGPGVQCGHMEDRDGGVHLEEGDYFGFVNREGDIRIALASHDGVDTTLRIYEFTPVGTNGPAGKACSSFQSLMINDSIQQDRFTAPLQQATPLIRVIISEFIHC